MCRLCLDKKPALFQLCSNSSYTSEIKEIIEFLLGQGIDTEVKYKFHSILPPIHIVDLASLFMPDVAKIIEDNIHSEAAAAAHVPPRWCTF